MTSQVQTITGNAGALNAVVGEIQMANCQATLYVAGTFVGTLTLQARPSGLGGAWAPVTPIGQAASGITSPAVYSFPPMAGDWEFQVQMTAYTSGTANVTLSAGPAIG